MGTALWVALATLIVVLVLFAVWRLRRAAGTVDRILHEERERERRRVNEEQPDVNSGDDAV